ncbi:unnamed protein product [Oppiella nova]|uniref:Nuclear receptor domain-containing protein n=1 Tax=Oppiella nova TaxID=334625 RepID=A0A7R9M4F0_9ACAR|nr:unnamed protein product [Oppiella nova]CAG2170587.1 unnamed protein product [Oppiella nova]
MTSETQIKVCLVCGDKSTGNHFDAQTCESCKSFFRRNALKNANLFYSDEQKQLRKSIIEGNRKRKANEMTETSDESVSSTPSPSLQTSDDIIFDDICYDESQTSSDVSIDNSFDNFSINTNTCDLDQSVIPITRPITDYSNNYNELEGNKLNELLDALKIFEIPVTTTEQPDNKPIVVRLDLFKVTPFDTSALSPYSNHKSFLENMGLDWDSDTLIIDLVSTTSGVLSSQGYHKA